MQNPSYENEFHLHVNENSFSHERPCTKTHFEKEVQENSEMAYSAKKNSKFCTSIFPQENMAAPRRKEKAKFTNSENSPRGSLLQARRKLFRYIN